MAPAEPLEIHRLIEGGDASAVRKTIAELREKAFFQTPRREAPGEDPRGKGEVLGGGQAERLGDDVKATALPSGQRQARPVPRASTCGRRSPVLVDGRRVVADPRGRRGRRGLDRRSIRRCRRWRWRGRSIVACGLSVTAGYHRLFAHRTYRAAAAVRWALLAFGAATFQNSALSWSADHRAHHADTDGSGDPHAGHPWRLVRPRRLAVPATRGVRRRHPAVGPVGGAQHPPAAPLLPRGRRRRRARRCRRSSPHSGATRGVGCSWPGSSVAPSCCRRRSA